MKVVILTVAAGGGHGNAAEAIKKHILLEDSTSEIFIIDTLKSINPLLDKVVIGSYLKSLKYSPSIFGKIYDSTEDGFTSAISSKLIQKFSSKIQELVTEINPDVIICTHPFPNEMVSHMKFNNEIKMPLVTILTDYAPHGMWIQNSIDAYIVSNDDMVEEMSSRGVQKDLIYPFGIPVQPDFLQKFDKNATLKELELSPDKITLLMMGGSLGLGKISTVFQKLMSSPLDIQIIVVAGKNEKLYNELINSKNNYNKNYAVIGYTNNVNKLMQASDLLLTKPGGLTITEALLTHLPMALFSPLPGQEMKNCDFLLKNNLAIHLYEEKDCVIEIGNLINSPQQLNTLKSNCEKFAKPHSAKNIYNLLQTLIKDYNLQKKTVTIDS